MAVSVNTGAHPVTIHIHTQLKDKTDRQFIRAREGDDSATSRSESAQAFNASLPEFRAFAILVRERFGDGVKLYPDRYGYLWEPVEPWRPRSQP